MNSAESQGGKRPQDEADAVSEASGEERSAASEAQRGESSLQQELAAAVRERDEYLDRWKRAQAELENYRKRVQREIEQNRPYQVLPIVRDLLPGLDNLQRAIKAAESSKNIDELVQGVQMVVAQFDDILARYSAEPIDAVGKPFDPNLHEALQQMPSEEHPPMTVVDELERGYRLHERVVRPSKVIVSSGPPQEKQPPPDGGAGEQAEDE